MIFVLKKRTIKVIQNIPNKQKRRKAME